VKAKVVRGYVDKMITLAKDGSLHARRQVRRTADSSSRTSTAAAANQHSSSSSSTEQSWLEE
jgi:ribosomal protein L17